MNSHGGESDAASASARPSAHSQSLHPAGSPQQHGEHEGPRRGLEWRLPPHWSVLALGEIADVTGGVAKDKKRDAEDGVRQVPYLRVANVQRGYLDLTEMKTIAASEAEIEELRLKPGDVLFNEGGDRDKLGRGWVWNGEIQECIHQNHVFRARIGGGIVEPRFLSHWANSFGQDWFARAGKQTTNLASISLERLTRFPVLLPPADEQERIVARIEELFSDLDAGTAALERVRKKLKRYRSAVLHAAVTGRLTAEWRKAHGPPAEPGDKLLARILIERRQQWEQRTLAKCARVGRTPPKNWQARYVEPAGPNTADLPELPEGWCWAIHDQIGDVQLGRQRSPAHHSGKHMRPYLRVANVHEERIDVSDVMEMNFTPEEFETYALKPGDILLNEGQSMEAIGRPAMYHAEVPGCCFQNTLVRQRVFSGVDADFALMAILAQFRTGRYRKIARITTSIAHLGAERFAVVEFPLPPLEEQWEIVEQVQEKVSRIDAMEAEVERGLARAARLRQAILKAAFEGKLVPQDPADEPAAALLERINAERAAAAGSRPARGRRTRKMVSP